MKRAVAFTFAILLLTGVFTGCGQKPVTSPEQTAQPVADTSWDDIKAKGKFVMGLDIAFPPMGFKDADGAIVGVDVDLATAVADELGVSVELRPIDWKMKETELNTGKIDVIWNGYTITDERRNKVLFSEPYLENRQVVLVKKGSDIKSKEDMKSGKVGAQSGSTAVDAIEADEEYAEALMPLLMSYDDNNSILLDLDAGRVKSIVLDEVVAKYYMSKAEGKYELLDEDFGGEEYGIGFRKEDKAFAKALTDALVALKDAGKIQEISDKWFGDDIIK